VDAYDSPTLLADSERYFKQNDGTNPLNSGKFADDFLNDEPATVGNEDLCGASGWRAEQSLDVQAVHSMAPGATILYVGGTDCLNTGLLDALSTVVTSGASVVTDSWGDILGDTFSDTATRAAFDTTFMLADSTGVSVLFSSGDDGDDFAISGDTTSNYPPSSPFITAVGGTTLEVNAAGHRGDEFGWSTAKLPMCVGVKTTTPVPHCTSTTAAGPLAWQAGSGGGTSFQYTQPSYQANVVPAALAFRNIAVAGVIADADQAANGTLGFLNPELYKAWTDTPSAFTDILPPANAKSASAIRVDFTNTFDGTNGFSISLRAINYEGPETYCDATGRCISGNVALTTAPGFDSMTGLGTISPKFPGTMSKF
jgi:subtilase family serine protease